MPVLLGVLVAASFGSGDFLGGYASRRVPTLVVLAVVQCCALVCAGVLVAVFGGTVTAHDLWLGAGAGALNAGALGCLYAGLATGRMGIVAPLTAVIAACIPVVWGVSQGEQLTTVAATGVGFAVVAGGLVAHERDEPAAGHRFGAVGYAVVAGILFGCSVILYAETAEASGPWPVLTGRVASVVLAVAALALLTDRRTIGPEEGGMAAGAGLLDVAATALLLVAVRRELVALVAPVASLGPAFTVMCAWIFLREPVARLQVLGLILALAGLVMIAAGR